MKLSILTIIICILTLSNCNNIANKKSDSDNSATEVATPKKDSTQSQNVVNQKDDCLGGDWAYYRLYGKVKSFKLSFWGEPLKFDENGFRYNINGTSSVDSVDTDGVNKFLISRDKLNGNRRIMEKMLDSKGNLLRTTKYEYNEKGLLVSEIELSKLFDNITVYTYDNFGNIKTLKETQCDSGKTDGIDKRNYTYEIIKVDQHGNWTERKVSGYNTEENYSATEKREIEYY